MHRTAVTIVELLVVLAILGLVIGLLLPAVQRARDTARRIQCATNLKQLGVALHAYNLTFAKYPTALAATVFRGGISAGSHIAPHVRLLPHLELSAVYDSVNFEFPFDLHPFDGWPVNTTAYARPIELFVCPADPAPPGPANGAANNYRFSTGSVASIQPHPRGGMFVAFEWHTDRDACDGLSVTAAASERCRGDFLRRRPGKGDYAYIGQPLTSYEADAAYVTCASAGFSNSQREFTAGVSWFHSGFHTTLYNHVGPPNCDIDCAAYGRSMPYTIRRGVFSAQSYHNAGVNLLLFDGHVRFLTDVTDLGVWRAMGTRCSADGPRDGF